MWFAMPRRTLFPTCMVISDVIREIDGLETVHQEPRIKIDYGNNSLGQRLARGYGHNERINGMTRTACGSLICFFLLTCPA